MADRRMFSKTILSSDKFLDLPLSAQALYFHICLQADDDGFVNCVNKIQRMLAATKADINLLVEKGFLIDLKDNIFVVTHWKVHNRIQNDRYKKTIYLEKKAQIRELDTRVYTLDPEWNQNGTKADPERIQNGSKAEPQVREEKVSRCQHREERIVPGSGGTNTLNGKTRFIPPSIDEVKAYCREMKYDIDTDKFWNYYESNGWMVGKNSMKNWKASVRTWLQRDKSASVRTTHQTNRRRSEPDILDGIL